ncbi:peptidase M14 [candidate division KSB1 bacterium]|nr:peptidase M14 [candidate division KSB1 bacterium]
MNRQSFWLICSSIILIIAGALCASGFAAAGSKRPALSFTKYYTYQELTAALKSLAETHPQLLKLESIGKSYEHRDIWLMTLNNPETGDEAAKAAMYIDGNIHGNEIQAAEVCLYTIWYLAENYGKIKKITDLVDQRVFYILPTVNPDGRAHWFDDPNTSHSQRGGVKPVDNDNDGLFDEDDYDDLDGDGEILQMRIKDPEGRFKVHPDDPRLMMYVRDDEKGEYTRLGEEGIDNDGDGKINEDGPGGYDPNRDWPADWRPRYMQYGVGDYPLHLPESQAVAKFVLAHPNIAGVQAYHNSGGMILRGPGSKEKGEYPGSDIKVYDALAKKGEVILPFYRYMVIWKDLYTVFGGFINWTYESLGIFSFTNELFSSNQYMNREPKTDQSWQERFESGSKQRMVFNDLVEFGDMFVEWKPYNHPQFGEIEIGGWKRFSRRINPSFMLPELCHRNCAFTLYHADQMPLPRIKNVDIVKLNNNVFKLRVTLENRREIPTVSQLASDRQLHRPDILSLEGESARVLSAGFLWNKWFGSVDLIEKQPERIVLKQGIKGNSTELIEWIVQGRGSARIKLDCLKGGIDEKRIELK